MMNALIKKLMEGNLPEEKLDSIMKQLLEHKFDSDLKAEYEKYLLEEMNVKRSSDGAEVGMPKNKGNVYLKLLGAILFLALALFFIYQSFFKTISSQSSMENYLAENVMYSHATVRNDAAAVDQSHTTAFEALNAKDYKAAVPLFDKIDSHTDETLFFSAYAKVRMGQYKEASEIFTTLSTQLGTEDKYYEETLLYNAICKLSMNPENKAAIASGLVQGSWSQKEFMKITGQ